MSTSSKEAGKIRAFKLLEMLTKIIKTGNARKSGEVDRSLRLEEGQEKSAGELVKLHLEKLSTAEIDFSQAREKVRLACFHLGQAYAQWIFELLKTLDVAVTSKTFHREAYPIVQAQLLKLRKQSNESSILKRLERARIFFLYGIPHWSGNINSMRELDRQKNGQNIYGVAFPIGEALQR
ncbi:uncharacterized protein FA14DRAFT_151902 [Meira miltonrushii]|uniref:Uncharacterized protein n=1 Tax=Meira miltonrushii TaxID=1280837 RepID=A0A316VG03_9BASI|nr:uncharacterized protein FA14DRAFT_151902 [Meira miltonrushii]PWN36456.1 hypothetical protein FA14DRAFT_151902 [Meira miltonrushii]